MCVYKFTYEIGRRKTRQVQLKESWFILQDHTHRYLVALIFVLRPATLFEDLTIKNDTSSYIQCP